VEAKALEKVRVSTWLIIVIERLANLRFFPRGVNITTRMPIVLSLCRKSKEELQAIRTDNSLPFINDDTPIVRITSLDGTMHYIDGADLESKIKSGMESFVQQSNNGLVRGIIITEFKIELYSSNVPDMELIDLPGVIQGILENEPNTLAKDTEDLTAKYIRDANTLVLTIFPCNERIRVNIMCKLLQQNNATDRCVGILTKCDETVSSDVRARVLGAAPDCITLSPYGYLGLSNGSRSNTFTISKIKDMEKDFFAEKFPDLVTDKFVTIDALNAKV
jgi:dynamin 1-like protein